MLQDPITAQMLAQNPKAQQIVAAMMAHIMEHYGFQYRKNLEEKIGVPYPAPNEQMDENMEVEISRLAAAGAQKLLQSNQAMMAQQQALQTMGREVRLRRLAPLPRQTPTSQHRERCHRRQLQTTHSEPFLVALDPSDCGVSHTLIALLMPMGRDVPTNQSAVVRFAQPHEARTPTG